MYRIRVFRAIDDLESCKKFAEGHLNVLKDYGVSKVTTAKLDWFYNPNVYVVLIESEDGERALGGERIHIAGNTEGDRLPCEEAVSIVDERVYDLVDKYRGNRTGELCGLWNSKEIAGKGFSFLLTKMGVALAILLKMNSLFVLCAPYTVEMCEKAGFVVEDSIGDKGKFVYPKLDLIATILIIKDLYNLPTADSDFRKRILDLASNPVQVSVETGPKGDFDVNFNLNWETK